MRAPSPTIELFPCALWEVRVSRRTGETRTVATTTRVHDVLGVTPDEIMADPAVLEQATHPDDRPVRRAAFAELVANPGREVRYEFRAVRRDGTIRWARATAASRLLDDDTVVIYGTSQDIHEEKRLGDASRRADEAACFIAGITAALPVVVWEARFGGHLERSHFVYVGERCTELVTVTSEELCADFDLMARAIHPEDLPRYIEAIAAAARPGATRVFVEARTRRPDGEYRWTRSDGTIREREDGTRSTYGYSVDIHADKAVEIELRRARDAAEAAARAKTVFLSTMSHEMRTPLNAVLGFAELVAQTHLEHEQAAYVASIQTSGEHLLAVINDILDFSKMESGRMEVARTAFALAPTVSAALDIVKPRAHAQGLALACVVDDAVPTGLVGDECRLRQVLVNLLSNAVKFTKAGTITVRVGAHPEGALTRFSIAVEDPGIGIPEANLDLLFRDFSQVDGSSTRGYGGTGLGLAISKRLVELMGGTIGVASRVGRGSTFTIELVAAAADVAPTRAPHADLRPSPALGQGDLRVLLVEDNHVNERVAVQFLKTLGYACDVAHDGAQALEALERAGYDVVLLDIEMPEMDGYETARRMRARSSEPRPFVVAITANVLPGAKEACLAAGMDAYLSKPIDRRALGAMLARVPRR